MKQFFISILVVVTFSVSAQHTNVQLGKSYSANYENIIYNPDANYHTSLKPIIKSNLDFDIDSLIDSNFLKENESWFLKKTFSEHLIVLKGDDYKVIASPIIHLSKGKELVNSKNTFTNTRGYFIEGDLGRKISFSTYFTENQSIFPNYLDSYIIDKNIVPGQGYARDFKQAGYDYAMSSGYVTYRANKMFAVQFGHGKHFLGDGYRSLLLSDNTFNYPYLRIQTTFGRFQYTNLYAEFMDINYFATHGLDNKDQMGYPKKYMSAHYLTLNTTRRFSLSLYEAVVWRMNHSPGVSGFDVNYLNPIVMLRPIEFSLNSPDNVLVGLNTKYKFSAFSSYLYGQLILDEFSLNDLRQNNGFWANKFGYQLGFKIFNTFKVKGLTLQSEYNYVRPYTYAHHNPEQNYAHYNQPLAHPLGANFSELLLMVNYSWRRFMIDGKVMLANYGAQINNDHRSYGNDLFMSTGGYADEEGLVGIGSGRPSDFGISMYQGNFTTVDYKSLNFSYLINYKTNLKIKLGVIFRNSRNNDGDLQTKFINFGIVSDLFNHYYDI